MFVCRNNSLSEGLPLKYFGICHGDWSYVDLNFKKRYSYFMSHTQGNFQSTSLTVNTPLRDLAWHNVRRDLKPEVDHHNFAENKPLKYLLFAFDSFTLTDTVRVKSPSEELIKISLVLLDEFNARSLTNLRFKVSSEIIYKSKWIFVSLLVFYQ